MDKKFDALNLVPRHISKFINRKKKGNQANFAAQNMALHQPVGHWGTVGSDTDYNLYPDSQNTDLVKALAHLQSVKPEQIFLGNGSDEVLDILVRMFCNPGKDHALTFSPTAARYEHFCALNGVQLHEIQLTGDFQLPIHKAKTSYTEQTKIVFIANPNPITGAALRNFDIIDILDSFEGIVIVDESLIEYNSEGSLLEHINQYPHLVIVQSFSQAWGMAGLRLGAAYAHPSIIRILSAMKAQHNINVVAQNVALKAIENAHQRTSFISETLQEREMLRAALFQFDFIHEIEDSQANFLLVKTPFPEQLIQYLNEAEISAFDASHLPGCSGGVRLTVGTPAQNERLLRVLREMVIKMSPTRRILRAVTSTLKKVGSFLGFFKKVMGGGS